MTAGPGLGEEGLQLGDTELQTGHVVLVLHPQSGELLTKVLLKTISVKTQKVFFYSDISIIIDF